MSTDLVTDLVEIQISPAAVARYRDLAHQVAADQSSLTAWLERYRPELSKPEHAEALRAGGSPCTCGAIACGAT